MLRALAGRPAALVTFLEGVWIRRPQPRHCAARGPGDGALHLAGQGFALRARQRAGRRRLAAALSSASQTRADEIAPGLAATIEQELDHLEAHWPADLPQGVIHADLFPDNVFFLGDAAVGPDRLLLRLQRRAGLRRRHRAQRLVLRERPRLQHHQGPGAAQGLPERARRSSAAEREALPLLARGAALRFLLTRAYDWLHTPQGCAGAAARTRCEYLRRLKFHRSVRSASEYGLEDAP